MKQLGDLLLPDSLQWIDRYTQPVTQTVVQTLAGTPVVFGSPQHSGWPLTLVAEAETTWLELTTVATLLAMAGQVGARFPLRWDDFACSVLFRHHDPPAVHFKPLWPHHNQFTGTIKLMAC
ncbi:MAG: hypothetical protein H7837_11240 [Magnetococcus sp. MYC-9]